MSRQRNYCPKCHGYHDYARGDMCLVCAQRAETLTLRVARKVIEKGYGYQAMSHRFARSLLTVNASGLPQSAPAHVSIRRILNETGHTPAYVADTLFRQLMIEENWQFVDAADSYQAAEILLDK